MKLFLVAVLVSLNCSAIASGKLPNRKTQIAVLRAMEKVGLLAERATGLGSIISINDANVKEAAAFMDRLAASASLEHRGLLVGVAEIALIKLDVNKDFTPLEALSQQKEEVDSSYHYIANMRVNTVDAVINFLENEKKVARFLALSAKLVPPTDDLDLPLSK